MPRGVYPRKPRAKDGRVVRTLRPDEPRPPGEPRRYPDRSGYVRLRWKVAKNEYVEIREHRAVLGIDVEHVHHRNHDTADNRLDNLVPLSAAEHSALHGLERRIWDRKRAAALYASGLSTTEVGGLYGINAATVSRGLRREGVAMRPFGSVPRIAVDEQAAVALHDAGIRWGAIAQRLGVSREVVERVMREHNRKPFPPGRPKEARSAHRA